MFACVALAVFSAGVQWTPVASAPPGTSGAQRTLVSGFAVSPAKIVLSVRQGKAPGAKILTVWSNTPEVTYTLVPLGGDWLKVSAVQGKKGSKQRRFAVTVDSTVLKHGGYDGAITVHAAGAGTGPVTVPVVVVVE